MMSEDFKMHQSLPVFIKRKLIVSSCYSSCCSNYSCDVDGKDKDYTYTYDNNNNNDERRLYDDEQQQIHICHCNLSTMSSPFNNSVLKERKRKCSIAKRLQSSDLMSSILVVMAMVTFVTRCVYVQGFSPYAITTSETTIDGRRIIQQRGFSTRQQQRQQQKRHNLCRQNSASSSSSIQFSHSPALQQEQEQEEAILSLEWIEFFAEDEISSEQQTQQQTPVLFLHGLLGSKRNFATCANMLGVQLDKKRRIMGVDLRNHGDTQPWSDNMSYPSMAQDVVHFLKSQNIEKIILVGHSMGGKVAQALALLHPEFVEGLVVLDIAPVTYSREEDPHWRAVEDILRAVHQVIEENAATAGAENTTKRDIDLSLRRSIPDPALRAFVLTNFDSRNNRWKIPIATMVQELDQIAGFDLTATATTATATTSVVGTPSLSSTTYEGDVFIINGGQSRFVRHAYMDTIASFFPNHMLTTIRGSGHWVHAEAPDDLVALLKRYLDR